MNVLGWLVYLYLLFVFVGVDIGVVCLVCFCLWLCIFFLWCELCCLYVCFFC